VKGERGALLLGKVITSPQGRRGEKVEKYQAIVSGGTEKKVPFVKRKKGLPKKMTAKEGVLIGGRGEVTDLDWRKEGNPRHACGKRH